MSEFCDYVIDDNKCSSFLFWHSNVLEPHMQGCMLFVYLRYLCSRCLPTLLSHSCPAQHKIDCSPSMIRTEKLHAALSARLPFV